MESLAILKFTPKSAAKVVEKIVQSSVANAGKKGEFLYIKEAWVCPGPALKRLRPMAMGRAGMIRRRTCHITLVVSDYPLRRPTLQRGENKARR